jgi:hypothetical protein
MIAGSRTNWGGGGAAYPEPVVEVEEVVPTHEARALVAYLLSLRAEVPLLERPMAVTAASGGGGVSTNGPASGLTNSPAL